MQRSLISLLATCIGLAAADVERDIINVSTPGSGTGDSLRTAFIKVNTNFFALWNAWTNGTIGGVGGNYLELPEQLNNPSSPASGYGRLYALSDGRVYYINTLGVTYDLTTAALSGEVAFDVISADEGNFESLNVVGAAYFDRIETPYLVVTNDIQLGAVGDYTDNWEESVLVPTKGAVYAKIEQAVAAIEVGASVVYDIDTTAWSTNADSFTLHTFSPVTNSAFHLIARVIGGGPTNDLEMEVRTAGRRTGTSAPTLRRATQSTQVFDTNYSHADLSTNVWWDVDGNTVQLRAKGFNPEHFVWTAKGWTHLTTNGIAGSGEGGVGGGGGEPATNLLTGLLAYWRFDETTGTRVDALGNHNLTVSGTSQYDTGVSTNAVEFYNNPANYLARPDHDDFSSDTFTFAGWVYLDVTNAASCLIAKDAVTSGSREYTLIWSATGNELRWLIATNATTSITIGSGTQLTPQTWYFFAAERNGTNLTAAVRTGDGTTLSDWSRSTSVGDFTTINTTQTLRMGLRNNADYPMDGRLDEIGFWNRTLTDDELNYLMTNSVYYPWGN